jgi:mannose-6-phosphate isomerase-like protein (cupin superfamily)
MSVTAVSELKLYDHTQGPRKLGPDDGTFVELMSVGVRFLAWGEETGGGFSFVEHPIEPMTLAAPVHIHEREDEYSFVLEGRLGAMLGDDVVYADEGDFVFKPRNQWHTFWNAGDTPCRILEIISPAGFEHFFDELADLLKQPDFAPEQIAALGERYGHHFDLERTAEVAKEHGLAFPLN